MILIIISLLIFSSVSLIFLWAHRSVRTTLDLSDLQADLDLYFLITAQHLCNQIQRLIPIRYRVLICL